ncbi:potassium channel family protein [Nocardioides conyzicola]|uniref:potassium channel family protein n=1 Tax=Nocardioides conyzicola TaxID=1651781 RepID=UPI0031EFE670
MPQTMSRVERWEKQSEVPLLLLLATAFLVAYAWPVLDPRLEPDLKTSLIIGSRAIWVAFAIDFVIRLYLADRRGHYALHHWYDVVLISAPMLRPLRLLRLLAFARILNRSAVGGLAGRVSIYVAGVALMSVGLGALAALDAERDAPGANITTAGDALWWAVSTVFTVGYGDTYPVTTQGRFVAVALMIVGIAVVSSVTAVIATWLIENVQREAGEDSRTDQ